jgi:hypothetical protein
MISKYPTAYNDNAEWTTPENAIGAPDGDTAVASVDNSTKRMFLTDYDFEIPADATINGIEVTGRGLVSGNAGAVVYLTKDGVDSVGMDEFFEWTDELDDSIVGSSDSLWDTTWTPAEINASTFGVDVVVNSLMGGQGTVEIDSVQITIYYTEASGRRRIIIMKGE